jgi:hypothetical protein
LSSKQAERAKIMSAAYNKHDSAFMEMESTTSPWTELYQHEDEQNTPSQHTRQYTRQRAGSKTQTMPASDSDADRPTHDALSAIYGA